MKSLKGFYHEIGSSEKEVQKIISELDKYYYSFDRVTVKENGKTKTRKIEPTCGKLKIIQKRITQKILNKVDLPPNVQGGVKGKCNISNARLHLGKKFHFCTDLKNFFPSINHRMVYNSLRETEFSPHIASLITKLTTFKGRLPQGTSSSSAIANIAFYPTDKKLIKLCNEQGIIYSRFVDDLVFSSPQHFKYLTNELLSIIATGKFKINHRKTYYAVGPIEITGIVVKHNRLEVPDKIKRKLKRDLSIEARIGLENYVKRIG